MSTKKISSLTVAAAIAMLATPALAAENNPNSELTFTCEVNNGVPTTVLETEGMQKVFFNWDNEEISASQDSLTLCKSVATKLNNYVREQGDLSDIAFKSGVQAEFIPSICATSDPELCDVTLFTLPKTEKALTVANSVLDDILNPSLKTVRTEDNVRGLQSITHSISLAELIFGRKVIKFSN